MYRCRSAVPALLALVTLGASATSCTPALVYVGIGTRETGDAAGDREAVDLIQRFGEKLESAGVTGKRLLVVVDKGATHREDAWARRLPRALEFLYGRSRAPRQAHWFQTCHVEPAKPRGVSSWFATDSFV